MFPHIRERVEALVGPPITQLLCGGKKKPPFKITGETGGGPKINIFFKTPFIRKMGLL